MDTPQAVPVPESSPAGVAAAVAGSPSDGRHVFRRVYGQFCGDFCAVCGDEPTVEGFAQAHLACEHDACKLLEFPQRRFATGACRAAFHDLMHPRLNPQDNPQRQPGETIKQGLLRLMADGRQRLAAELAAALRIDGGTCARELRKLKAAGHPLHTARLQGPRRPAVWYLSRTTEAA